MGREDADHAVEDDDRSSEDGRSTEPPERLHPLPVVCELGCALEPMLRFFLETSGNEALETCRNARVDRRDGARVAMNDVVNRLVRR